MILIAFGTLPEIITPFPVVNALKRGYPYKTLITGKQMDFCAREGTRPTAAPGDLHPERAAKKIIDVLLGERG
jgi:hypothetical protein